MKFFPIIILLFILASCMPQTTDTSCPRYIVTSPELAEILYELGASDGIVGVTAECSWPARFDSLTKVGTFGSIDIETLMSLHPTHVFTSKLEQQALGAELQKLGIPVYAFYPSTLRGLYEVIDSLAILTQHQQQGHQLVGRMQSAIDSLQHLNDLRSSPKPRVYVEIYGNPVMSVSDESFVGQLIDLAGGENIFETLPRDYSRVNPEKVVAAAPDVMIITYPGVTVASILERKGWGNIPAVKQKRIFTIDDINTDLILRATPRCISGIKMLQRAFYE